MLEWANILDIKRALDTIKILHKFISILQVMSRKQSSNQSIAIPKVIQPNYSKKLSPATNSSITILEATFWNLFQHCKTSSTFERKPRQTGKEKSASFLGDIKYHYLKCEEQSAYNAGIVAWMLDQAEHLKCGPRKVSPNLQFLTAPIISRGVFHCVVRVWRKESWQVEVLQNARKKALSHAL